MPLNPSLRREGQADFEIEARLVYKAISRIARAVAQRNPVTGGKRKREKKKDRKNRHLWFLLFKFAIF